MHCGECKYFGWRGLQRHCRHPEHVKPIRKWPGRCADFVDHEAKAMPGVKPKWPDPVSLVDFQPETLNGTRINTEEADLTLNHS